MVTTVMASRTSRNVNKKKYEMMDHNRTWPRRNPAWDTMGRRSVGGELDAGKGRGRFHPARVRADEQRPVR